MVVYLIIIVITINANIPNIYILQILLLIISPPRGIVHIVSHYRVLVGGKSNYLFFLIKPTVVIVYGECFRVIGHRVFIHKQNYKEIDSDFNTAHVCHGGEFPRSERSTYTIAYVPIRPEALKRPNEFHQKSVIHTKFHRRPLIHTRIYIHIYTNII